MTAPDPGAHAPKIFGIGLNKTATSSLHTALEALGFSSLHFGGPPVRLRIQATANEKRPLVDDFPEYDAFSDIVYLSKKYRLLDRQYPGSKFILTTRDLDGWLDSRRRHVERNIELARQGRYDRGFLTVETKAWTQEWDEHHAAVLEYFAGRPDDLLVMDIPAGDGYDRLCPFLGRPVPETPFPWSNRAPDEPPRARRILRTWNWRAAERYVPAPIARRVRGLIRPT